MRIYLVGFMGAGKSTIGSALAARLRWEFIDLDKEIERREHRSIPEIFETCGERAFRSLETKVLGETCRLVRTVFATGGGTFTNPRNVELIKKSGVSVFLDVPSTVLINRIERSPRPRPLFRDPVQAKALLDERRPSYELADITLRVREGSDVHEVVEGIVARLREDPCVT